MTELINNSKDKNVCTRKRPKGSEHWNWKGGRQDNSNPYIRIYKPDHHYADSDGYVAEHRLVVEEHFNYILLPWASIHHINKNKKDNRIENLMVFPSDSKHKSYELLENLDYSCFLCHSKETTTQLKKSGVLTFRWYNYEMWVICSKCHDKERYYKNLEANRLKAKLRMRKKRNG